MYYCDNNVKFSEIVKKKSGKLAVTLERDLTSLDSCLEPLKHQQNEIIKKLNNLENKICRIDFMSNQRLKGQDNWKQLTMVIIVIVAAFVLSFIK